jgi:predicted dehydrogenase
LLAERDRRGTIAVVVSAARWPLRVAVVGVGAWGLEHARAWAGMPGIELVALCEREERRLQTVARDLAVETTYVSAHALAREVDIDIVSIVTPEEDRLGVTLPFLERGVHALVEKPFAVTVEDATKLREAGVAHDVYVMPGHVLRFDARMAALKAEIERGSLGELRSVYSRRLIPRGRHGTYARAHPALVAAIHDYDLARWLIAAEPVTVTSHALHRGDEAVPDILWSTFTFPDHRVAVVENAWVIPDEAGVWLEAELEVIGSEGVARVRLPGDLSFWLSSGHTLPDTTLVPFALGTATGALRDELSYFAGCVARGVAPDRVTADDGVEAVRLALAAADSGTRGTPVDFDRDAAGHHE